MPRDAQGLALSDVWARTSALVADPSTLGVTRAGGFTTPFGVDMFVTLQVWNRFLQEISAMLLDIQDHGILEWSATPNRPYKHPCIVFGSDGDLYVSQQAGGEQQDPTTDTNGTFWVSLTDQLAAFATAGQVDSGSSSTLAVTPLRLLQGLFKESPNDQWKATTDRFGLAERATEAEIQARSGDGFVAADDLPAIPAAPPSASTTAEGIARRATEDEADGGSASSPFMTPALVKRRIDALIGSPPMTLNTLEEIADAIGDDPDFHENVIEAPSADGLYGVRVTGGTPAYERLPFEIFVRQSNVGRQNFIDGVINGQNSWTVNGPGLFFGAAIVTSNHLVQFRFVPPPKPPRLLPTISISNVLNYGGSARAIASFTLFGLSADSSYAFGLTGVDPFGNPIPDDLIAQEAALLVRQIA